KRSNYGFNVNYRFDDKKTSWNVDADYGIFRNRREEYQPNAYLSADESTTLSERNYSTTAPTNIDILTFKVDYERPVWDGKLGVGLKTTYVNTDNTFENYQIINDVPVLDINRSSQFEYKENVNAVYTSFTKQIKKFGIQIGLRLEQTNSRGTLLADVITDDDDVKRSYIDLFPSGGLTYNLNRKNSLQLNYSRRLDRPDYQNLNPFQFRQDELSYYAGNPFLRPQYTNNFQLSHTYNYRFVTSFSFSQTKDLMTRVSDLDGDQRFLAWINLTDQFNYSLAFSAPVAITKWWGSFSSLTAYHTYNRAEQTAEINTVDLKVYAARLYSQHTFTLPWKMKFEVSGWYGSPSVWGGTFRTDGMFGIDAGLQKKFWDGKGNIRLGMSDIFNSQNWSGSSEYGILRTESNGGWDSQRFKIDISYFFGNDKVKSRKRKTGLEEETKRTSGGSG
ncbi:MAG: outer membrane beta-barrel family protein, partial [Saprospiraceae bacterium]